jgi:hypothetical protein
MNRVAIILIALSTLAIALLLGWDRYAEWRITQDPGYRASNVICESKDARAMLTGSAALRQDASECWEDLEQRYGASRRRATGAVKPDSPAESNVW